MQPFSLDRDRARESVPEFVALYRSRPLAQNPLGMGFNHCFATWFILRTMRPKLVVESGVWRGQSTWLIEQAVPDAEIVAIDPRPESRVYTSPRARYETIDFSRLDWSRADTTSAVVFFDDHQNAYERLKDMHWLGFRHAIFEDNYPCGEGDFYSLRHLQAGFGHRHLQMSPAYARTPREVLKRWLVEPLLRKIGPAQTMIVPPNDADRANLARHLDTYLEFPAVALQPHTNWGGAWSGAYQPVPPLLSSLANVAAAAGKDIGLEYSHIAYVALKD